MSQKGERRYEKKLKRQRKERKSATSKEKHSHRQASTPQFKHDSEPPPGYSTPLIKHFAFEHPLLGLTAEQRSVIANSIGESAESDFQKGLCELIDAVKQHDPFELLATSAFYTQFKGVGSDTDFTEEVAYPQAIVEVLQSICLKYTAADYGIIPMLHPYLFRILDLSKQCSKDFGLKRFSSLADVTPEKRGVEIVIEAARSHTQLMRNWGYPQHMRKISLELFEPLEEDIQVRLGVGPRSLCSLTDFLMKSCCDRAFQFTTTLGDAFRARNLRKMARAFFERSDSSDKDEEGIYDILKSRPGTLEDKRRFCLSYFHHILPSVFTFTLANFAEVFGEGVPTTQLQSVLDVLSFHLGDLSNENPEHLFMHSKIRSRPMIAINEGTYFVPIPGLFNSFFIEIVESWLKPFPELKDRYHRRRASYLESSLESLLVGSFPGALVQTGTTWIDESNGKEYENDCLVVCGPIAIVFEAKSERVDDVAKRGGVKTLKDHYETLVSEPAEQATRLAKLLEEGTGIRMFRTRSGHEFELDLSVIRRAVCVSVTLDWFPAATLCWKQLVKSGLVSTTARPAINMTLADLMIVLEVLESPAKRIHYFWRRTEWESAMEYLGDEHDLLVYYLSGGLMIPRNEDGVPIDGLSLYGISDELHRYYMAEWVGHENLPSRPRRILSQWWSLIIQKIELLVDQPHMWDIACVLLDLDHGRQCDFEKQFEEVVKAVRLYGNDCGKNGLITFANHTESAGAVVGFAYKSLSTQERNGRASELASQALRDAKAQRVVVIGRDVERLGNPYDFVVYYDGTFESSK